jgi:hypothetical protein
MQEGANAVPLAEPALKECTLWADSRCDLSHARDGQAGLMNWRSSDFVQKTFSRPFKNLYALQPTPLTPDRPNYRIPDFNRHPTSDSGSAL